MWSTRFRQLITNPAPRGFERWMLAGLEICEPAYRFMIESRNTAFDRGWLATERVGAPVISVGNLTVGGTGKTPLIIALAKALIAGGYTPAIVSRGYGSRAGQLNDEGRELATELPGVPQMQHPNRVFAVGQLRKRATFDCVLLDDGFQHRRIARDLDIVVVDATDPFGRGHLLPRGFLREPVRGLRRADILVVSRVSRIDESDRRSLVRKLRSLAPRAMLAEADFSAKDLVDCEGRTGPLTELRGLRVAAFAGIGNPTAFTALLREIPVELRGFHELPDHCSYDGACRRELSDWIRSRNDLNMLLCTRKDLVKVQALELGGVPLRAVRGEIYWRHGGAEAMTRMLDILAAKARRDPGHPVAGPSGKTLGSPIKDATVAPPRR